MTSQRILQMALAWKSMARQIDPGLDGAGRNYTAAQVTMLLNSLIDWLVGLAALEVATEKKFCECDVPGTPYASDLVEDAKLHIGTQEVQ